MQTLSLAPLDSLIPSLAGEEEEEEEIPEDQGGHQHPLKMLLWQSFPHNHNLVQEKHFSQASVG